jgi:hypothetical protein
MLIYIFFCLRPTTNATPMCSCAKRGKSVTHAKLPSTIVQAAFFQLCVCVWFSISSCPPEPCKWRLLRMIPMKPEKSLCVLFFSG